MRVLDVSGAHSEKRFGAYSMIGFSNWRARGPKNKTREVQGGNGGGQFLIYEVAQAVAVNLLAEGPRQRSTEKIDVPRAGDCQTER